MQGATCANGHTMLDGDAFCGECGAVPASTASARPAAPSGGSQLDVGKVPALACAEGHPNTPDDSYCGACGAAIGTPHPSDDSSESDAAERGTSDRSGRRIWIAVGMAAVAIALVVMVSNRDSGSASSDDTSRSEYLNTDESESLGTTRLGCEVLPIRGTDATMVDPPYCTNVKLIEEYCGWPEDEVGYPPDVNGAVIRFTRLNPSYPLGAATFSVQGAGEPYERTSLLCIGGRDSAHFWTAAEWSALISPS